MSYVLELPLHTLRYLQSAFKDFCYVFCKHDIDDYNGEDFSWLDVKHVPYCKSRYMDHVTREMPIPCCYRVYGPIFHNISLFDESRSSRFLRDCQFRWSEARLHGGWFLQTSIHRTRFNWHGSTFWRVHVCISGLHISFIFWDIFSISGLPQGFFQST